MFRNGSRDLRPGLSHSAASRLELLRSRRNWLLARAGGDTRAYMGRSEAIAGGDTRAYMGRSEAIAGGDTRGYMDRGNHWSHQVSIPMWQMRPMR